MRLRLGYTVLVGAVVLVTCGSSEPPVLTLLSPDREYSTTESVTLTVRGSGFRDDSQIVFNHQAKTTRFVAATELTCTITSYDLAVTPGQSQIVTAPVHVSTPQAADSNSLDFSIAIYPQFSAATRIADSTTSYSDSLRPVVRIDDTGQLHVVWRDREELLFSLSSNGGTSWSQPKTIHTSPANSYRFSMTIDRTAAAVLVAWEESSVILLARSTDSGERWTSPVALTTPATTSASSPGMLVEPSGTTFLAYLGSSPRGGPPYSVVILRSSDHGVSFREISRIPWSTYFSGEKGPQLAMDPTGGLCLVFPSELGTRYATSYLTLSTDDGLGWSTPSQVSLVAPSLATDAQSAINLVGANMYLPYQHKLTFRRSTDRGGSWTSSDFAGTSYSLSDLVVNPFGSTDVVWANRFVRSFDHGSTWGPAVAYAGDRQADAPSFVEDSSGTVVIVWWDPNGGIYSTSSRP